jgi:hypothetical protein
VGYVFGHPEAGMSQAQNVVDVRHQGRRIGTGIATGNNATWSCGCGRSEWLIGRTGDLAGTWNRLRVRCPGCEAEYFVFPAGKDQGAVDYVERV